MKYIHGFFCMFFGCLGVMALAAAPFVLIVSDGISCFLMLVIAAWCAVLSISFNESMWRCERRDLERQWWEARDNG